MIMEKDSFLKFAFSLIFAGLITLDLFILTFLILDLILFKGLSFREQIFLMSMVLTFLALPGAMFFYNRKLKTKKELIE